MFKKKGLEFKIVDDSILSIADYDWYIDKINLIYIDVSCMNNNKFSIYIATDNEIDKLYFESKKYEEVLSEFRILCFALMDVKPNFMIHGFRCFNFDNITTIDHSKKLIVNMALGHSMKITFNNLYTLTLDVSESELKSYLYQIDCVKNQGKTI